MSYTQLTREERYQIYALKKAGHKQSEIAKVLERSASTISRELARNRGLRGYRPKQAHSLAMERRAMNARTIDAATWQFAQEKLLQQWSPEQISAYADISQQTLYQRIYADLSGRAAQRTCAARSCAGNAKHDRRSAIPNKLSIEQRPAIVETRCRVGDWEADTIIGRNH